MHTRLQNQKGQAFITIPVEAIVTVYVKKGHFMSLAELEENKIWERQ